MDRPTPSSKTTEYFSRTVRSTSYHHYDICTTGVENSTPWWTKPYGVAGILIIALTCEVGIGGDALTRVISDRVPNVLGYHSPITIVTILYIVNEGE